jgi:hypothetical protein
MIVGILCSVLFATIISIVWVRLIDQSNKMLEQDKKRKQMTPKHKALNLVKKYLEIDWWIIDGLDMEDWLDDYTLEEAQEFALIAVEEIVNIECIDVQYWIEVAEEIKKIQEYDLE